MVVTTDRSWPAGHRAALCITIGINGSSFARSGPATDDSHFSIQTEYDPVGTDNLLDLLADAGVTATFCWTAPSALDRRDQVQRAVAEGHEIAMYSDDRGSHGEMSIEERRLDMERSLDVLAGIAGQRPVGHKSAAWQDNESTHRVAQEMGLQWIMDIPNGDFPSFVQPESSRPPLVNLPPSWMQDDYTFYVNRIVTPRATAEFWQDDLDVLRERGGLMALTLHPYVSGRPGPSRAVTNIIDYAVDLGDIWIARADHIARWWQEAYGGTVSQRAGHP